MTRKMKVYLPRWTRWLVFPMLLLIWGVVTYETFASGAEREGLGVAAWLGLTVVLVLLGVMLWLMTAGRLPVYVVEVDDTNDPTRPS